MLGSFRNRRAGVLIWALMVVLVVGLAGLGIGVGGGLDQPVVARVGDQPISSRRLRPRHAAGAARPPGSSAASCRWPRPASTASTASCSPGSSTTPPSTPRPRPARPLAGDERVREQVMATPAFQGADGEFGRDAYTYALEQHRPAARRVRGRCCAARWRARRSPAGVQAAAQHARDRGADRARLPRREAELRLDPPRRRASCPRRSPPRPTPSSRPSTTPTPPTATPGPRPGRSPTRASPPTRSPRPSRSPRTSCAPPTTPTSPATRPPSAAALDRIGFATPRRPPRPRRGSTPARSTSTPSPPSAA